MRWLVVVIAVVALVHPAHAAEAAEPADTVARFVAAGGIAKRNPAGAVIDLDLRACAVTNADLVTLAGLGDLVALRLSGKSGATTVDDTGLGALAPLTKLRVLMLDHLWVGGDGLAAITPLVNLEELTLAQTLVRDEDLEVVAKFPRLRRLRLARTAVTGAGLAHLAALEGLRDLDLSESVQLDDAALEPVGRLTSLRRLNLWRVPISDAGVAPLAGLGDLEWLNLADTPHTDMSAATTMHSDRDGIPSTRTPNQYDTTSTIGVTTHDVITPGSPSSSSRPKSTSAPNTTSPVLIRNSPFMAGANSRGTPTVLPMRMPTARAQSGYSRL